MLAIRGAVSGAPDSGSFVRLSTLLAPTTIVWADKGSESMVSYLVHTVESWHRELHVFTGEIRHSAHMASEADPLLWAVSLSATQRLLGRVEQKIEAVHEEEDGYTKLNTELCVMLKSKMQQLNEVEQMQQENIMSTVDTLEFLGELSNNKMLKGANATENAALLFAACQNMSKFCTEYTNEYQKLSAIVKPS